MQLCKPELIIDSLRTLRMAAARFDRQSSKVTETNHPQTFYFLPLCIHTLSMEPFCDPIAFPSSAELTQNARRLHLICIKLWLPNYFVNSVHGTALVCAPHPCLECPQREREGRLETTGYSQSDVTKHTEAKINGQSLLTSLNKMLPKALK